MGWPTSTDGNVRADCGSVRNIYTINLDHIPWNLSCPHVQNQTDKIYLNLYQFTPQYLHYPFLAMKQLLCSCQKVQGAARVDKSWF